VTWMTRGGGQRTRGLGRRRLSFPGVRRRGGWRKRGGGELRVVISGVGSARNRTRGGYHQVRKEKGERSGRKEGAWPHLRCRFRAETLQMRRTTARNSARLAVSRAGGRKGDGGGARGVLIGEARGQNGPVLNGNLIREGSYCEEETVTSVVFGQRRETGLTHGAHMSARGRENRGYRFGLS
jgi:hypothetical protein